MGGRTRYSQTMKVDLREVRSIARQARKWAEELAAKSRGEVASDLCGLCAIAAGHLHKRLRAAGLPSVLAVNSGHCFVLLGGYVVDVTATQFQGYERRRILIKKLMDLRNETEGRWQNHWRIEHTAVARRDMRKYQLDQGWDPHETVAAPSIAGA